MPGSNDVDQIIWPDRATILHDARCDGVAEAVETILDGSDATLITKNINANGTYLASSDNADGYSSVTVEVPNTYTTGDEGKVVSNGALISQTSTNVTSNGTVDTTTNNEVVVAVPNTYTQADENKVVHNGALTAQTSDTTTENGVVDTTLISSLTVNVPSGGGVVSDVNFYDYDGTIVNSYSAAEFAQLNEMPTNPTHEGLTAQGWNWSLSDAKTYVASYGKLNIGQMYTTSDGKTRLYITITEGRTSPILKLTLASGSEVDVDWGDGTAHDTLSGSGDKTTNRHEYTSAGSYVISITVNSGSIVIPRFILSDGNASAASPDRAYLNAIKKVEIGDSVTGIDAYVFNGCSSLSVITIPSSVTSIGNTAFQYCSSLSSITIPSSVTSIGGNAFQYCSSLSSITIPSSVTGIGGGAFSNCSSLSSITIPSSVTGIGDGAFGICYSLSSITIPSSVTSIGSSAFSSCYSLSSITIPSGVTSIGSNAFQKCYSLATIIILGKSSGDISGAPWGANTGSPTNTQIIWENDQ